MLSDETIYCISIWLFKNKYKWMKEMFLQELFK